jgi:hypothetical protein
MWNYEPVDDRAQYSLDYILSNLQTFLDTCSNKHEIMAVLNETLPSHLAHTIELRMRITDSGTTLNNAAYFFVEDYIRESVSVHISPKNDTAYFTHEDIVDWWQSTGQQLGQVLLPPQEETITISVKHLPHAHELTLTHDQMNGIAFALLSLECDEVTLTSSITSQPILCRNITDRAILYLTPPTRLERQYRVQIKQNSQHYRQLYFSHPQFMQGILSVAAWLNLPNQGHNTLWRNLEEETTEGIRPLTF